MSQSEAMKTILVVEDEGIVARDIQRTLKKLGYNVPAVAATGADALDRAAELSPDLVMMDIHIKGDIDGIETAQQMRQYFGTPIIFLTAFSDDETLQRAKMAQPYGYLLKPFEERELLSVIEVALHKHEMEQRLRESEARLSRIVETNADAIIIVDVDGRISFANAAAERIFGLPRDEIIQRTHDAPQWNLRTLDGRPFPPEELPFARISREGRPIYGVELCVDNADGRRLVVSTNAAALTDATGRFIGMTSSVTDVTTRKALEERLAYQAFHDPLTNLPNRALFTNRLSHALSRNNRNHTEITVMFVDLDNFKWVNDSLGHAAGDRLLIAVAERLQKCLRSGDTAARFGGDEFVLLIDSLHNPNHALRVAERIVQSLQEPFMLEGREVFTSPSIGVAFSRAHDSDPPDLPEDLLRHADAAMYEAKRKGKARCEVFEAGLGQAAMARLEIENDLHRALINDELVMHYQPTINLATGKVHGVEALVRWQHPVHGLMPPSEFIALAEETGLIIPIGLWVLRETCRYGRELHALFPQHSPLKMGVNLSARQIHYPLALSGGAAVHHADAAHGAAVAGANGHGTSATRLVVAPLNGHADNTHADISLRPRQHVGLVGDVAAVLRETGFDPRSLVLEITENAAMGEAQAAIEVLNALKTLGVRLAIDDFGTGYSSLAYLRAFPFDYLKIDRKFISGIDKDSGEAIIVSSMIGLAHSLHLKVVAEGVETIAEVDQLHDMDCDLAQGFYFARPMTETDLRAFLEEQNESTHQVQVKVPQKASAVL